MQRQRNRGAPRAQDPGEEVEIWANIQTLLNKLFEGEERSKVINKEILELEMKLGADKKSTFFFLFSLYRTS